MNIKKNICYVAGKSGGHIIPCLTLLENTKEKYNHVLFFSSNTSLDKTILSNNPKIDFHIMLTFNSRKKFFLILLANALYSFFISFFYLYKYRPERIVTTGGIVALTPCIVAFLLRIPIIVYSLDAMPGKAIQAISPLATSIVTCFSTAQKYFPAHKCTFESYPIKYQNTCNIDKHNACISLGLSSEKKTIVILGGSQGSFFLNQCIAQWIDNISFNPKSIQIIHQTGRDDSINWKEMYTSKNIPSHIFSYNADLAPVYTAADLIICRGGAGTLFEIKFFNKQCIVIPLKTNTTHHQIDNAYAMNSEYPHLFQILLQETIEKNPSFLFEKLNTILDYD